MKQVTHRSNKPLAITLLAPGLSTLAHRVQIQPACRLADHISVDAGLIERAGQR